MSMTKNTPTTKEDSAMNRTTNPEKVRQIIEQYIDQVDVLVHDNGFVRHPVWLDSNWKFEAAFPEKAIILEMMDKPYGLQKVNDMAKAAIKDFIRKRSLDSIFCDLGMPFGFKILRDAKEHMSADDFTRLLRTTWEASDFAFCADNDFSDDDLWELLQSCDPQKFMTSEEWEQFQQSVSLPETLFRGEESPDSFIWTDIDSLGELLRTGDERFGEVYYYRGYTAHVHSEDIFAIVLGDSCTGYIVNPDKLEDVEDEDDLRMYCDRDELPEECWEDDDDDD